MTLILTVQSSGSIWMVADRRLSFERSPPIDNAIKATVVDVFDGIAIVGYAGLGATALRNQPSQWVSNLLRGRHHPIEQMLKVIADAMQQAFPPHLNSFRDIQDRQHRFLIPAFVNDQPRTFTIELTYAPSGYIFRHSNHIMGGKLLPLRIATPLALAGSGAACLERDTRWVRPTLSLVGAYNRKKVSAFGVADQLARLAYSSHEQTKKTVGPDCIVIWRNSRKGAHKGGGSQAYYSNQKRVSVPSGTPSISSGLDMQALSAVIMRHVGPHMSNMLAAAQAGKSEPEAQGLEEQINEDLGALPSGPDEELR